MPNKPPRDRTARHDASYKGFFARRRIVADSLRGAVRELARHLDFSTLERLPASFVTERLSQRRADMLWRARTVGGGWLWLLVLLEFQSTIDRRMALRMTDYTVRILRGLGREDLGPGGEYPPVLPVVVYNGGRRWTAATDVRDLFAQAPEEVLGYLPRHRYVLIDVQGLDLSRLPPDNALSMIARFERAGSPEEVEELLAPLADWLERVGDPELVERFGAWIDLVLARRWGAEGRELDLRPRNKEGRVTTLIERSRKWGEEFRREWLAKGIEQGIEQGERELLLRMATRRFGPEAADDLVPLLARISDSDELAAIAAQVFACETAEELVERARGG